MKSRRQDREREVMAEAAREAPRAKASVGALVEASAEVPELNPPSRSRNVLAPLARHKCLSKPAIK
jgi:hypothetical protein